MELTEKDMFYIANGRMAKERLMILLKIMAITFIPFVLLMFLGETPGLVIGVVWAFLGIILLNIKLRNKDKDAEAKAAEMWQAWQTKQKLPKG